MTLAATGTLIYPQKLYQLTTSSTTLGRSNLTFDSTTDRIAYMGRAPLADTLSKVYFALQTVTTGCTLLVQIESVTNGRPSGTIIAAGASGTVVVADTDDNIWKTATIGTPPTLAAGDEFAIVISYSSGTTPSMQFVSPEGNYGADFSYFPGVLQDTGAGTWAAYGLFLQMIVEMGAAGVVNLPNLAPSTGNGTITGFNNSSSPDEYALKITVPFKCRVRGLYCGVFNVAAGADFTISLWPSSSTTDSDALGQALIDGDYPLNATADGYYSVYFAPVTLEGGSTYYIGVRAETANNLAIGRINVDAGITNAMNGFPIPATCHSATRAWTAGSAGAWTDLTTSLPLLYLIIDQLDDGTGGGRAALSIGV